MINFNKIYSALILSSCMLLLIVSEGIANNPGYNGIEFATGEAVQDSTERQELLDKVRERGSLHIWVYYKMENYDPEMAQFQRGEIAQKHSEFMHKIGGLNVRSVRQMEATPRTALFADEEALFEIFEMEMVDKVTEMRRGRIH
ncbi:MAG: hypothetical protein LAT84_14455 [Balneolia bacterium]|nr:hypothetical protein [Balneolia bacterium]